MKMNWGSDYYILIEIDLNETKNNNAPGIDGMQAEILTFTRKKQQTGQLIVSSTHKIVKIPRFQEKYNSNTGLEQEVRKGVR